MTLNDQLHKSRSHRPGWDQSCPRCVADGGIDAIIRHLLEKAKENEAAAHPQYYGTADAVAAEQRRMVGVLRLYRKVSAQPAAPGVTA